MEYKISYDWHSQDNRIKGPMETANSVVAQYGTGGGNTPFIVHNKIATFEEQSFSRFQCSRNMTTLKAVGGGVSYGGEALIASMEPHYIVRRLMPLECSRLQGFPDGWGASKPCPPICPIKLPNSGVRFI